MINQAGNKKIMPLLTGVLKTWLQDYFMGFYLSDLLVH
jgi:hypothetical protein